MYDYFFWKRPCSQACIFANKPSLGGSIFDPRPGPVFAAAPEDPAFLAGPFLAAGRASPDQASGVLRLMVGAAGAAGFAAGNGAFWRVSSDNTYGANAGGATGAGAGGGG